MKACLQRDPSKRPTAAALLEHPWLARQGVASIADGVSSSASSSSSGNGSSSSSERPLDDTLVQRLQRYGTYGRFKQVGCVCHVLYGAVCCRQLLQPLPALHIPPPTMLPALGRCAVGCTNRAAFMNKLWLLFWCWHALLLMLPYAVTMSPCPPRPLPRCSWRCATWRPPWQQMTPRCRGWPKSSGRWTRTAAGASPTTRWSPCSTAAGV